MVRRWLVRSVVHSMEQLLSNVLKTENGDFVSIADPRGAFLECGTYVFLFCFFCLEEKVRSVLRFILQSLCSKGRYRSPTRTSKNVDMYFFL